MNWTRDGDVFVEYKYITYYIHNLNSVNLRSQNIFVSSFQYTYSLLYNSLCVSLTDTIESKLLFLFVPQLGVRDRFIRQKYIPSIFLKTPAGTQTVTLI